MVMLCHANLLPRLIPMYYLLIVVFLSTNSHMSSEYSGQRIHTLDSLASVGNSEDDTCFDS